VVSSGSDPGAYDLVLTVVPPKVGNCPGTGGCGWDTGAGRSICEDEVLSKMQRKPPIRYLRPETPTQEVLHMSIVSSTLKNVHSNPFNGRCIHGKQGAILHKGSLFNPKCSCCVRMVADARK